MVAGARALEQTNYVGVDIAPSPPPPPTLPKQCFKLPACFTHSRQSAASSTVSQLQKAQLKMEQNANFQARIELACPEGCWHSAILFQRLTIFNLKTRQRPLKKSLDSIECDQIGYHNLSVHSKNLCKVDYTENPQDIHLVKVNNNQIPEQLL